MPLAKPDLTRIWAQGAPSGNVVDPDTTTVGKFAAGWVAEIPPFEHFNFLQKLFTESAAYNNEQGVNEWDASTTYPVNALVKGSDGTIYKAILEQNNNDPIVDDRTNWKIAGVDFKIPSVVNLKTLPLQSGDIVETTSYYQHSSTVEGKGGATYQILTLAEWQTLTGLITPDTYGDHVLNNGNVANLLNRESTHIDQFGAIADGITDDTVRIQAAVNTSKYIKFSRSTYSIQGTVEIPSYTYINGGNATFLGIMNIEGTGGYPNQMFRNSETVSGNTNIKFKNVNFDFAKDSFNYDSAVGLTSINSLLFVNANNLQFENCLFFDFVTNYDTSLTGKDLLLFGMAQFDNCSKVSFKNIKNENIREEGFNFYQCYDVDFDGWEGQGAVVNTSSHAGLWYCVGVSVRNAVFVHTGGSVINNYSSNVVYDNIRVNDGETQDGRGFDFGNELDAISFDTKNITINNCYLNVQDYGVFVQNVSTNNDQMESIKITNNTILVSTGSDGVCFGIRTLNPVACEISNNYIFLSDVATVGLGQCVFLTLTTDTAATGFSSNVKVTGNYLRGLTGVYTLQNIDCSMDGLYIQNNTFQSQDRGVLTTYNGASVFFYVRNNTSAVSEFNLSDVYVQNNVAYNLGGGTVVISLDDSVDFALSNLVITDNKFSGPSGSNMDRCLFINGGTGSLGTKDMRYSNNIIENGGSQFIFNLLYLQMNANVFRWDTAFTGTRIQVTNHVGTVDITNNRCYNCTTAANDLTSSGTASYNIINMSGNVTYTDVATLVWASSMPANTVLPN